MKIALISCTSRKKAYKCPAGELYSESPRFRMAYTLAKLVADKIFILSAKYGLISEDTIIEPYNETLKEKTIRERRTWGDRVLSELQKVSDLEHDHFIILAGEVYHENLVPHLAHLWLPLKGKSLGEWIPELKRLIRLESESDKAVVLHMLFDGLPRMDWTMINQIPYKNGIYIMFEKGERFHGMDRIVRIGTHRGQDRLLNRLRDHFVTEDADSSIFRKNIGRAFLNMASDPYLEVWDMDRKNPDNAEKSSQIINEALETQLEAKISKFLRENITFVCFPVDDELERLRLEEGIIATLNKHPSFGPNSNWFGLHSPIQEIASSGLWNRQGLQGQPLSDEELERIKWLIRFGNDSYISKKRRPPERRTKNSAGMTVETAGLQRTTSEAIRLHIERLMHEAKWRGEEFIDLVSGDIHKQMGMKDRMPQVCSVMYKMMKPGDEILHTTPSGKSSTIKIRYDLRKR